MAESQAPQVFAEYITIGEAAEMLGVSPWTLRNWDKAGKLKTARHPHNGYRIYRREDLAAILGPGMSRTNLRERLTPHFDFDQVGRPAHLVQFYETDTYLIDSVSRFIGAGLGSGEGAIVIATAAHRNALHRKLRARGLDLRAARDSGQYVALDAAETLAKIMVGSAPDAARFDAVIGGAVAQTAVGRPGLRAFGEMVALLWAEGNQAAAIELEHLWNDLGKRHTFALLCGYPLQDVAGDERAQPFAEVCTCHSHVLPAESYTDLKTEEERLRAITQLQQKARVLEVEIAERVVAEQAQARLAAIVESSQDAIVSKTLQGIILTWNKGAERLFGYTAEEAVGRSITMLIPPDRQHEEQVILARIGRGEVIEHFETVRVSKDGRPIDISLTISPVRDRAGRIIAASKIARDVTDQKRAQEALRQSERRFRMALASGVVTAFEQDIDLRYTWVYPQDPSFPEFNIGRTDAELMPGEEGTELMRLKREVLTTRTAARHTIKAILPKETRYYDLLVEPRYDRGGALAGIGGAAVDITAQKQVEAALREADRRKDEFLTVLAHELRNPLAPVRNALQIMRLAGDNRMAVEQSLAMMERQVAHLVRLVDDLLDVSRITRGKVELRKERVPLSTIVASAVETSRPLVEAARHELHIALPSETLELEADSTRLAQVLSNLLNNAAKYTEPGGKIWLTAELASRGCERPEVVIRVRDTGIGIPCEMLPRVFDMFLQVERSSEKTQGGLGVGLTLVRTLVHMHGGRIEAHSDGPGQGSEFTLRLPLAPPREPAAAGVNGRKSKRPSLPMRRMLIVDDNTDAAQSLAMLLRMLGQDVRTAADGPEALVLARDFQPQVALLDLGLPGMSGLELAKKWRADPACANALLVALTGWGQEEDRRRSQEAGFDEHLTKPAEPRQLEELIRRTGAAT